jgi:hypothetical protein
VRYKDNRDCIGDLTIFLTATYVTIFEAPVKRKIERDDEQDVMRDDAISTEEYQAKKSRLPYKPVHELQLVVNRISDQ